MLALALMNLDLALQKDQPDALTDESSLEDKKNFEQWERCDRVSLMIIKQKIPEHYVRVLSEETSNAKSFLAAAEKYFAKNEKAEISALLSNLVSMRYQGKGNVREHIMEMASLASKLKALKLDVSEDLLVHLVLISLPAQFGRIEVVYNCQKEKWSLNELISHCVHEEERLNPDMAGSVDSTLRTKVCFVCKNSGHVKKDCPLYHAKRTQKGKY